ncbi:DUF1351 domain-containing protein [Lederbergia wuyishanensis]|uniref:DUF1351 domain-containing protein n=1 Tax=Lederbergia wuyishanensis TaxID=1347903 RepID=A0ABU0D4L5_9BACI|nr:DUF1351 domain-containing protein [Lederbergia wuyishanensis]MCJ8008093.1 DUF1351 domain-containing protein [Lederbergia wuyishanensis]MDQ0343321.1 hypothetical protein [Lederbergia wuyishanensis]
MNNLQVKTITLTPAIVEFNFYELSAILDDSLKKYEGLTFTEKDVAECKKTIAELNKGKKALDTYRKETKKQLTASVTEFENKCKELNKKFDSVIAPLKEQHDQFEDDRKEQKRKQIQDVIDELLDKEGLNEKYSAQLTITEEYFNKSKTIKSIKEELTAKAEHLGIKQDKEDADQEIIKSHVQLINTKFKVNLPESAYVSLLDYGAEVPNIKEQIEQDAEKEVERLLSYVEATNVETNHEDNVTVPDEAIDEKTFTEMYKVIGTESQLDALEEFMNNEEIEWQVIEE